MDHKNTGIENYGITKSNIIPQLGIIATCSSLISSCGVVITTLAFQAGRTGLIQSLARPLLKISK
jgi:hypothetical protein